MRHGCGQWAIVARDKGDRGSRVSSRGIMPSSFFFSAAGGSSRCSVEGRWKKRNGTGWAAECGEEQNVREPEDAVRTSGAHNSGFVRTLPLVGTDVIRPLWQGTPGGTQ